MLVVDDEPAIARTLRRLLRAEGYMVDCADGGDDARHLVEQWDYDVVISDVGMPRGGGIELLQHLNRTQPDVPVVLVTGAPEVKSAVQAFQFGAFHYLVKPLDRDDLLGVVRKAVQMRRFALVGRQAAELLGAGGTSLELHRLEASLRRAVDSMWVAYQPIVRTSAPTEVYGYEALMRSNEPSLPSPPAVISAAERLGRLKHVGRRVRDRAVEAFESAPAGALLFVNLHPADLTDPSLLDEGSVLCQMSRRVILEVTERASVEGIRDLRRCTAELRERGYRIAIDDLGSGFSGLNSFALLEPDVVKIDMALVRDVHLSATKGKLIRSIVSLAHDMGIEVVAEGVETHRERDALVDLGCDLLQGYFIARPGPPFPPLTGS